MKKYRVNVNGTVYEVAIEVMDGSAPVAAPAAPVAAPAAPAALRGRAPPAGSSSLSSWNQINGPRSKRSGISRAGWASIPRA